MTTGLEHFRRPLIVSTPETLVHPRNSGAQSAQTWDTDSSHRIQRSFLRMPAHARHDVCLQTAVLPLGHAGHRPGTTWDSKDPQPS
jgi:hypothetical protein